MPTLFRLLWPPFSVLTLAGMRGRWNVRLRNLKGSLIYLFKFTLICKINDWFYHVPCISPEVALGFNVSLHSNLCPGQSDLGQSDLGL